LTPSFDVARFRALAAARQLSLGAPLEYAAVTPSTNDLALAAARADARPGTTFVAGTQTAGRGRRGHSWLSNPAENLLFSVLLRPRVAPARVSALTLAVGLAVRDAVQPRLAAAVKLKWPNDLLIERQKLAGILLESQLQGAELRAVVVGVGLNVSAREFPSELAERATSLWLAGAQELEHEPLLVDILQALERRVESYEAHGLTALLPELSECDALVGRRIRVESVSGTARGIDGEGYLLIEDDSNALHRVAAGTVEWLDA
jgi:BirA family biotin operon repressor/biotin-[acetyl-CoA-carboxylase] ligase